MLTGSSSFALAISSHCPSWSSNASRVRSAGSMSPEVPDAFASIDRALLVQVESARRRREHLAYPVGRQRDVGAVRKHRHAFAAPSCEVGDHDLLTEVQLGLEDDPPAAWSAAALAEGADELIAERRARERMRHGGTRVGVEGSVDDLGDPVRGCVKHVLVGSPAGRIVFVHSGLGHRAFLGSGYRAAALAAHKPREHVSAGVGAGPGACSQVRDVGPAHQASPDERRCDLELAGLVLDGLGTRCAHRPSLTALSRVLGDDASAAPASSPASRGALEQLQRKPHCTGISRGSRGWLRIGHGREPYHPTMNRDTITTRCSV